jgi:hypothetical protein
LDAPLNEALRAINAGETASACGALTGFTGEVGAQSGKVLTTNQASQLIGGAREVQRLLSCS